MFSVIDHQPGHAAVDADVFAGDEAALCGQRKSAAHQMQERSIRCLFSSHGSTIPGMHSGFSPWKRYEMRFCSSSLQKNLQIDRGGKVLNEI